MSAPEATDPTVADARTSGRRQILLAEYDDLRGEALVRLQKQQEITNFALLAVGALAAIAKFGTKVDLSKVPALWLFAIGSCVMSSFTLMILEHDLVIAQLATYIRSEVEPRLRRLSGEPLLLPSLDPETEVFRWDLRRAEWDRAAPDSIAMHLAKYLMTLIPNCLFVAGFWIAFSHQTSLGHALIFCIPAVLFVIVGRAARLVARSYTRLERRDPT